MTGPDSSGGGATLLTVCSTPRRLRDHPSAGRVQEVGMPIGMRVPVRLRGISAGACLSRTDAEVRVGNDSESACSSLRRAGRAALRSSSRRCGGWLRAAPAHAGLEYADWHQFLLARWMRPPRTCKLTALSSTAAPGARTSPCTSSIPCRMPCRSCRRLLDMPEIELPGDHDMPRVQDGPSALRSGSRCPRGTKIRVIFTFLAGRAGIRCRPTTEPDSWTGRSATATVSARASEHRLMLQPE